MTRALRGRRSRRTIPVLGISRARFQQAVRMGSWKAIRLKKDAPLELYNLAADPGEQRDVAANNPNVVARIEEYLKTADGLRTLADKVMPQTRLSHRRRVAGDRRHNG